MVHVALDIGSGFTGYTDGDTEGFLQSLVSPLPGDLGFGGDHAEYVEVNGARFLVGTDAITIGNPDELMDTCTDRWAGSQGWLALLYAAIARLNVQSGEEIHLITGLPQKWYMRDEKALIQKLSGKHTFKVGGANARELEVVIKPEIAPQATAALVYLASTDESVLSDTTGLMDVGTFTTGLSVLQAQRFVARRSGGIEFGVNNLLKALDAHLVNERGYKAPTEQLPNILMSGKYRFRGQEYPVETTDMAMTVAQPMLDYASQLWGAAGDLRVFVAGGGAPIFLNAIKTRLPHAQLVPDAFYSVLRGLRTIQQTRQAA